MLHLDRPGESDVGEVTEYKGTYSQYKAASARDEVRLAKIAARQQTEIARLQTLVDRWGAKASKAAFAKSLESTKSHWTVSRSKRASLMTACA